MTTEALKRGWLPRRRSFLVRGVVAGATLWLGGVLGRPGDAAASSAEEPMIVVELLQAGFAGASGERTTVAADGVYKVERVLNGQVRAMLREGRLTPATTDMVRRLIGAARLGDMPARLGAPPAVNATTLTVRAGAFVRTVLAQGGTEVDRLTKMARDAPGAPEARLAELAAQLLTLTAP